MIVDQALYSEGRRLPCPDLSEALSSLASGERTGFVWIGLKDPTDSEFDGVRHDLGLHSLAVEDAVNGHQRVKVEHYDQTVFAVLKTLRYVESTSDIETGEVMIFFADNFVVTIRRGEAAPLVGVRHELEHNPQTMIDNGAAAVFHAVLDAIVDTYRAIDTEVLRDLEQIEETVFTTGDRAKSSTIYLLKREVLEFRRAAAPLLRPVQWLHGERSPIESVELRLQFRDVADHLIQVVDHIDTYDGLLTDVLNAHLAQIGVQQNDDMRKISAWVAIAAVPTLLAGIFGMNFENMPGLTWTWGYPAVLVLMAVICVSLYRAFRRSGWL
ncbi:MAG: magnesium/cobalt transporter CorA [Actinobacteria bacterium]|nr:magnesium/cobalt transporter CorA [Actinomycetota bacterium]